ncbi:hypothetical protein L1049_027543 [Liquidambar formosana]|uniref:Uncharacterized protein n=1 Tax=Liquidambar formosana TaxID=63359 RepID=A0AAP0RHG2_LIQFO
MHMALGLPVMLVGVRFSRPKKMKEYMGYVQNLEDGVLGHCDNNYVDSKDMAVDVVMLSLRTARGLDLRSFGEAFGGSLVLSLCEAYRQYVESGHVVCLDEQGSTITADELSSLLSNED